MSQLDRIEAKLDALGLQLATLIDALGEDEQQTPAFDLDGNKLPTAGDENGPL